MRQFTERILFWEKLPTEFWKSCRTKSGKVADRNLEKLPNGHCIVSRCVIKYAANEKISPKNC